MSAAANQPERDARIRIVEEHIKAENEHDVNGIMETFKDSSHFFLNGLTIEGKDGIRALYEGFGFGNNGGFSEIKAETVKRYIGDDNITLELVLSGIHTGEWQGIPSTNKKFEVPACAIFCFDEEGRLESERVYFDMSLVLKQLGVIGK
jgi:steroid delta-isomerase-like uncharacterized protein